MARFGIQKWIAFFGRLIDGGGTPRQLRITERPEHTLSAQPSQRELLEETAILAQPAGRPDRAMVARVFDSAHPVRARDELFGRASELEALLSATLDFGQHAIVHGARGSGKTSLIRVYGDHADQRGVIVIYMACEPGATFAELLWPYLHALPAIAMAPGERVRFRDGLGRLPQQFRPGAFVDLIAECIITRTVFIFDEFDRITDPTVKSEIAAAMKLLSDSLADVVFALVGIAGNVADLIEGHPSLRRHMRVVTLGRIEPTEVNALVDAGEAATGLLFDEDARRVIARAACGSPFHVRMFCHHAAIAALRHGSSTVVVEDVRAGLLTAIQQWAAMNPEDAQHFVTLVEQTDRLPEIERIAQVAASRDRIPAAMGDGSGLLDGNSVVREGNGEFFVFRDSVAPQFLVAYAILAEFASSSQKFNQTRRVIHAPDR